MSDHSIANALSKINKLTIWANDLGAYIAEFEHSRMYANTVVGQVEMTSFSAATSFT